jgi:glutathione synthase/RimK-type ligase-like ATP-grasp enzyme
MNDPLCQFHADRKVRQMEIAGRLGFLIPNTLISADVMRIRDFCIRFERIVMKSHGGQSSAHGTRFVDPLNDNDWFSAEEPYIFQGFIDAEWEHRIIFVDGQVFGGSFNLSSHQYDPDIREIRGLVSSKMNISMPLREKVVGYCRLFNLRYAAFDIRQRGNEFYFLEANTCGEWLYIDACNNGEISNAVVAALQKPF